MSEAKIRFDEAGGYTTLFNSVVRDPRLSLKTVGLLVKMKSLVNTEWEFSVSGMAKYCQVGKDAIRGCLQELEDAGYLLRERTHKDDGTFGGNEYVIFETSKKTLGNEDGDHRREIPTMDKTQRRQKPSSVNQTQIKEITQVKENKIPPVSPKGDKPSRGGLSAEVKAMIEEYARGYPDLYGLLEAFMEVRAKRKAINSPAAVKLLLSKLDKLSDGNDILRQQLVETAVENGWKTVYEMKAPSQMAGGAGYSRPAKEARLPEW